MADPVDSVTAWLQSAPQEVRDKIVGGLHTVQASAHPGHLQAKADVNYRKADDVAKCGDCMYFQEGSCKLVAGNINPDYVCDLFAPKDGYNDDAGTESGDASDGGTAG